MQGFSCSRNQRYVLRIAEAITCRTHRRMEGSSCCKKRPPIHTPLERQSSPAVCTTGLAVRFSSPSLLQFSGGFQVCSEVCPSRSQLFGRGRLSRLPEQSANARSFNRQLVAAVPSPSGFVIIEAQKIRTLLLLLLSLAHVRCYGIDGLGWSLFNTCMFAEHSDGVFHVP